MHPTQLIPHTLHTHSTHIHTPHTYTHYTHTPHTHTSHMHTTHNILCTYTTHIDTLYNTYYTSIHIPHAYHTTQTHHKHIHTLSLKHLWINNSQFHSSSFGCSLIGNRLSPLPNCFWGRVPLNVGLFMVILFPFLSRQSFDTITPVFSAALPFY